MLATRLAVLGRPSSGKLVPGAFRHAHRLGRVRVRAGPGRGPDSKDGTRQDDEPRGPKKSGGIGKALETALTAARDSWSGLDTQQRLYTVLAGGALAAAAPTLAAVLLIPLERLLVGGLLALEEVLALLLLQGVRLVGLFGFIGLVLAGAYIFLFPKKERS